MINTEQYYDFSSGEIFNLLIDGTKQQELKRYNNHMEFIECVKNRVPEHIFKEIENSLSEYEKDLLFFGRISKDYVEQTVKNNTRFDRRYKDGTLEKGEFTTFNLLINEVEEKITLAYFAHFLGLDVIANPEAVHNSFYNHEDKKYKNTSSDLDFCLKSDNDILIELQTNFTPKYKKDPSRDLIFPIDSINWKVGKVHMFEQLLKDGKTPIFCNKRIGAATKAARYYFYDVAMILEKATFTKIDKKYVDEHKVMKNGRKVIDNKNPYVKSWLAQGGHDIYVIENIPKEAIYCIDAVGQKIDLEKYKVSAENYRGKCFNKEEIGTSLGDLLKAVLSKTDNTTTTNITLER